MQRTLVIAGRPGSAGAVWVRRPGCRPRQGRPASGRRRRSRRPHPGGTATAQVGAAHGPDAQEDLRRLHPPAARTSTTGTLPPSRRHRWRASCWDTGPQGSDRWAPENDPPSAGTSPAAYRCIGYAADASRKPFSAQVSHRRCCYRSPGVLECSSTKCSGFSGVPGPVVLLASGLVFQAGDLRGNAQVDDCIAVAAGMAAVRDGQKKAAGSPSGVLAPGFSCGARGGSGQRFWGGPVIDS